MADEGRWPLDHKDSARVSISKHGRPWLLFAAALALETAYAGFLLERFSLLAYLPTPLLDLGKIGGYDPAAGLTMAGVLAAVFGAHALAWRASRCLDRYDVVPVLLLSLIFQVTLALVYPIAAADVFNYALQGRLLEQHGLNPLIARPADVADPWLPFSAYPNIQLAYGPLWAVVAAGVTYLAGDNLLLAVMGFKLLAIGVNIANSILIYHIVLKLRREAALPALVLYAWSPLVLFETVMNAHNDGVLALALLLAIWLILRSRLAATLAPSAITMAVLVKYTPVIVLPMVLIAAWRRLRSLPALGLGLLGGGVLVVLAYLPFWQGLATFDGLRLQSGEATTSWVALLIAAKTGGLDKEAWLRIAQLAAGSVLILVMWRQRPTGSKALPMAIFDIFLAYLLVGTFWFQAWYLVPLVAVAAASADERRAWLAIVFSCSATASYLVYFYLWITPWWGTLSDPELLGLACAVVYLPPVLLGLAWMTRRGHAHVSGKAAIG